MSPLKEVRLELPLPSEGFIIEQALSWGDVYKTLACTLYKSAPKSIPQTWLRDQSTPGSIPLGTKWLHTDLPNNILYTRCKTLNAWLEEEGYGVTLTCEDGSVAAL